MLDSKKPKPPNAVNRLAKDKAGEHMARRPGKKKTLKQQMPSILKEVVNLDIFKDQTKKSSKYR